MRSQRIGQGFESLRLHQTGRALVCAPCSSFIHKKSGDIAQPGERSPHTREVVGSSPAVSTKTKALALASAFVLGFDPFDRFGMKHALGQMRCLRFKALPRASLENAASAAFYDANEWAHLSESVFFDKSRRTSPALVVIASKCAGIQPARTPRCRSCALDARRSCCGLWVFKRAHTTAFSMFHLRRWGDAMTQAACMAMILFTMQKALCPPCD